MNNDRRELPTSWLNLPESFDFSRGLTQEQVEQLEERMPFRITTHLRGMLHDGTYPFAAFLQYMPDVQELEMHADYRIDPTHEMDYVQGDQESKSIFQVYDNRALLLATKTCLVDCRFCVRGDFLETLADKVNELRLAKGLAYIKSKRTISEVVVSGGDPFAIKHGRFVKLLTDLSDPVELPNIKNIRIDTRALNVDPRKHVLDNTEFLSFLEGPAARDEYGISKLSVFMHANHPADLKHKDTRLAIAAIRNRGVSVFNQGVILAGVNDDPAVMRELWDTCRELGVHPYHLYVLDTVAGAAHMAVPSERIVEIYMALTDLSGIALPILVWVKRNNQKEYLMSKDHETVVKFLERRDQALELVPSSEATKQLGGVALQTEQS